LRSKKEVKIQEVKSKGLKMLKFRDRIGHSTSREILTLLPYDNQKDLSKEIDMYYVYALKQCNGIPFYVGCTCNLYRIKRHKLLALNNQHTKPMNLFMNEIDYNYDHEILYKTEDRDEAIYIEEYWIDAFGRKDLGKGPLLNLGAGVNGNIGRKLEEVTVMKHKNNTAALWEDDGYRTKRTESQKKFYKTKEGKEKIARFTDMITKNNPMKDPKVKAKVSGENNCMKRPEMREWFSKNNPMKKRETRAKFSGENNPNAKKVEIDGTVYGSIADACRELNITKDKFYKILRETNRINYI
jgi:hypothetical protein